MKELTLLLGVLLSIGVGFAAFRFARGIAAGGIIPAILTTVGILLIGGLVSRFVVPAIADAVRGFYGMSASNGMGLAVGLGMFALAIIISGSMLSSLSGPGRGQIAWIATLFVGAVYGKILFWSELVFWWNSQVLPSNTNWAMGLSNNAYFFIFIAGLVATLSLAKFVSSKF